MEPNKKQQFKLPVSIVTESDISQLIYELEKIENFFLQIKMRRAGDNMTLPKTTSPMEELVTINELSLLKEGDREKLKFILTTIRNKSPVIHMSFSSTPNQKFLEKVIVWLRQNISDVIILQVGLQPNIGAGFTLRTTNKFFDFSLRQHLDKKRDLLISEIHKVSDDGPRPENK